MLENINSASINKIFQSKVLSKNLSQCYFVLCQRFTLVQLLLDFGNCFSRKFSYLIWNSCWSIIEPFFFLFNSFLQSISFVFLLSSLSLFFCTFFLFLFFLPEFLCFFLSFLLCLFSSQSFLLFPLSSLLLLALFLLFSLFFLSFQTFFLRQQFFSLVLQFLSAQFGFFRLLICLYAEICQERLNCLGGDIVGIYFEREALKVFWYFQIFGLVIDDCNFFVFCYQTSDLRFLSCAQLSLRPDKQNIFAFHAVPFPRFLFEKIQVRFVRNFCDNLQKRCNASGFWSAC